MASRAFWFYVFAIPDIFNPPSVIPDVLNPPSVIPDVFNRESTGCSQVGGQTNERTEEKDTGFPLKTGGNDREARAGMTRGERRECQDSGPRYGRLHTIHPHTNDKQRTGMKAKSGAAPRPSFPQVLAGIQGLLPGGGPHFPLCPIPDIFKPPSVHGVARLLVLRLCHSRRFQSLSVIPDVFNRESTGCSHVGATRMKGQKRKTRDSR